MNSMLLAASSGFGANRCLHKNASSLALPPTASSSNNSTKKSVSARLARKATEDDEDQQQPQPQLSFRPDFSLLADLTLSPPKGEQAPRNHAVISSELPTEQVSAALPFELAPRASFTTSRSASLSWTKKRSQQKIAAWDVASVGNASDTMVPVPAMERSHSDSSSSSATTTTNSPPSMTISSSATATATTSAYIYSSGRDLHESAKLDLNQGNYEQALVAFQAILTAQTARFGGVHHASVGAAIHNVGICHQRMQQHEPAEHCLKRAVTIRQATLGRDHLEVAASLSKLGAARAALQKYDDAFEDIMQAIRIAKDQLGREHKTVAQMYCHLGCFYYEAGELFAAQATFMEAYEIYRAAWPNVSNRDNLMQQMCDTLGNIGSIQNKRKRYADAILTFTEALDLQRGIMVHDHPRIIATLDNLAFSYSKHKEHAKALHCYSTMLQSQLFNNADTFSEGAMDSFCKQILMYEKLKRYSDALQAARETLLVATTRLPASHKIVAQINELIGVLEKKAKTKKAR